MTPREVGKQVQETIGEQVRDLPIHAARLAMFGVGRALLLTDRVTKDVKSLREGEVRPVLDRLLDDAGALTARFEGTPVGRVLERLEQFVPRTEAAPAPTPVAKPPRPSAAPRPPAAPKEPEVVVGKPAPEPVVEPEPVPGPATTPVAKAARVTLADLPVPNYDELTHASLRARLRKLTAAEVTLLREYEAANADRPEIVRMYDNRLAKLAELAEQS